MKDKSKLVSLKKFYMVAGWFAKAQYDKSDGSDFEWDDEDQGIVEGNLIKLRDILSESKFKNVSIVTKINYEWKNCNEVSPCPYLHTARASLVAPIFLAIFTLLTIICWSKCFKKGMLYPRTATGMVGTLPP